MPEHAAARDELEARLARALRGSNGRNYRLLMFYLGSPPDPHKIPEWVWKQVERDLERTPVSWWRRAWRLAFTAVGTLIGVILATRLVQSKSEQAERDRQERAAHFARKRTEAMQARLERIKQVEQRRKARAVEPDKIKPVDWEKEVRKTVGLPPVGEEDKPSGSEKMQARTEVTREISRGEVDYVEAVEIQTGVDIVKVWYTERDGHVCPICAPLHKKTEEVYGPVSPGGPPAHPNCRCWLTYRSAKDFPGTQSGEIN